MNESLVNDSEELIALMSVGDLDTIIRAARIPPLVLSERLRAVDLPQNLFEDKKSFIGLVQVWQLFSTLSLTMNDEQLGLAVRPVPVGTTELIVARAMQADNLKEAMIAFANAANLVMPDVRFSVKHRLNEIHFCLAYTGGDGEARQIFLEATAVALHSSLRWLTGLSFPVKKFRTSRSRSTSRAMHFLAVLDCSIEFGEAGVDIVYDSQYADIPLTPRKIEGWRTGIYRFFLKDLERRRKHYSASEITHYVECALRQGVQDLSDIARSAGMAETTLRRKLRAERTSFRKLGDLVLKEVATEEIVSGATIEAIAERLGYADARSFRRAFRRLFGMSPAEYREKVKIN